MHVAEDEEAAAEDEGAAAALALEAILEAEPVVARNFSSSRAG